MSEIFRPHQYKECKDCPVLEHSIEKNLQLLPQPIQKKTGLFRKLILHIRNGAPKTALSFACYDYDPGYGKVPCEKWMAAQIQRSPSKHSPNILTDEKVHCPGMKNARKQQFS